MYLQLENVEKYYGENENRVQVLKGVNGSIERGEICVMLGPSGSGKSTLLNLIGGIEIIDYGNVIVGGIDLAYVDGEYYFIEVNPTGEWGWLEVKTGIQISMHIKKFLCNEV